MRRVLASLFLACTAAPGSHAADAAQSAQLRFDPYNPVILNELAMSKIREGDTATAWILLERAVLLAPHDARIQSNLQTVRYWRRGKMPADFTPPNAPGTTEQPSIGDDVSGFPPLPPLIWPKK